VTASQQLPLAVHLPFLRPGKRSVSHRQCIFSALSFEAPDLHC
jgi:hypothetical protein